MIKSNTTVNMILLLLLVVFSLTVVKVRHDFRITFVSLQDKQKQKQFLQSEQGRLFIERATWARENNLIEDAKNKFGMFAPDAGNIITLKNVRSEGV